MFVCKHIKVMQITVFPLISPPGKLFFNPSENGGVIGGRGQQLVSKQLENKLALENKKLHAAEEGIDCHSSPYWRHIAPI